jgi:hypothetical protein
MKRKDFVWNPARTEKLFKRPRSRSAEENVRPAQINPANGLDGSA